MYSNLASTISFLVLSTFTVPAFSHSGHTSVSHIHGALEILFILAIAVILYRIAK